MIFPWSLVHGTETDRGLERDGVIGKVRKRVNGNRETRLAREVASRECIEVGGEARDRKSVKRSTSKLDGACSREPVKLPIEPRESSGSTVFQRGAARSRVNTFFFRRRRWTAPVYPRSSAKLPLQ